MRDLIEGARRFGAELSLEYAGDSIKCWGVSIPKTFSPEEQWRRLEALKASQALGSAFYYIDPSDLVAATHALSFDQYRALVERGYIVRPEKML